MSVSQNRIKFSDDRSMKPKGPANARGQQQGLKIKVEERNGSCDAVGLSYMIRENTWVNMNLPAVEYQTFVDAVEDCIRNPEMEPITVYETRGGAEHARITVMRDGDGRVAAKFEGQGNSVMVTWMPLKTYGLLKNNQPMSVKEQSERNARSWCKQQHRILDLLEESYVPFTPQAAGSGFKPRYNNNGGGGNQQYQQRPPLPAQQPATATQDEFF